MARGKRNAADAQLDEEQEDPSNTDAKSEMLGEMEALYERMSPEDVMAEIERAYEDWGILDTEATFVDITQRCFRNFGVPTSTAVDFNANSTRFTDIELRAWREEARGMLLLQRVRSLGEELEPQQFEQVGRILEAIFYAKKLVFSAVFVKHASQLACCGSQAPVLPEEMDKRFGLWGLRFRWIGEGSSDLSAFQNLLLYLMDTAQERGYRKQDDNVMCQIMTPEGESTHAWKPVCTISEFVDSCTSKERDWEAWRWKTYTSGTRDNIIDQLTKADDYQFPKLFQDRSTFSFTNGIYRADKDRFCRFDEVGSTIAAVKFFDMDFPVECVEHRSWSEIDTPYMESVMDAQDWDVDVKKWLYVLFGRLLYDVGAKDGWQVVPFLLGLAGTGKSLLTTKVAKMFYPSALVGVLGNNIEKRFGLSSFHDKLMFIAPELRNDLQLDQAEFQSMVSGEEVLLAQKFKTAVAVKWKPPGILAGNELPTWADSSGSIARRVVVWDFGKPVTNPDMSMEEKLAAEIGKIIVKCNRAYLEQAAAIGRQSIWNHLPEYFKRTQSKMAADTNSVEAFLMSGGLQFGQQLYMPLDDFKKAVKAYEMNNSFKAQKLTMDLFRTSFTRHQLEIVRESLPYGGRKLSRDYVIGADIVQSAVLEMV